MCASVEQHSILFDRLAHVDWDYMEVVQLAYPAGWWQRKRPGSVSMRSEIFLQMKLMIQSRMAH